MENRILAPTLMLRSIGMHPRYKGYAYVQFILSLILQRPEYLYNLRAAVYPRVIERFGCTQAGIERNIRFVVQKTFETGDPDKLEHIFGDRKCWPPTNTEFIAVLAQSILFELAEFAGENAYAVVK